MNWIVVSDHLYSMASQPYIVLSATWGDDPSLFLQFQKQHFEFLVPACLNYNKIAQFSPFDLYLVVSKVENCAWIQPRLLSHKGREPKWQSVFPSSPWKWQKPVMPLTWTNCCKQFFLFSFRNSSLACQAAFLSLDELLKCLDPKYCLICAGSYLSLVTPSSCRLHLLCMEYVKSLIEIN